jgi:hypothetical protein
MTTKPLPPPNEDPSIVKGQQLRAEFTPTVQRTRTDSRLSNLQVAEQVAAFWETTNTQLAALFRNLQARRQARIATLETVVPLGPAIPAGSTAADTVVLQQAFRAALAEARAAMPTSPHEPTIAPLSKVTNTLDAMLADAEKFDDDNLRRAVLTAAYEAGRMDIVRRWTDLMGVTKQLDEFYELQRAVAGEGIAASWNMVAFEPVRQPPEVAELSRLRAAEEGAAATRARLAVSETRHRSY